MEKDHHNQLTVTANDNFLSYIVSEIRNETLFVYSNGVSLKQPVTINVGVENLKSIFARGAREIETPSTWNTENLSLHLQGASKANVSVSVQNQLEMTLEGAYHIKMQGICKDLNLRACGASKVKARDLIAKNGVVKVLGASTTDIYD